MNARNAKLEMSEEEKARHNEILTLTNAELAQKAREAARYVRAQIAAKKALTEPKAVRTKVAERSRKARTAARRKGARVLRAAKSPLRS